MDLDVQTYLYWFTEKENVLCFSEIIFFFFFIMFCLIQYQPTIKFESLTKHFSWFNFLKYNFSKPVKMLTN